MLSSLSVEGPKISNVDEPAILQPGPKSKSIEPANSWDALEVLACVVRNADIPNTHQENVVKSSMPTAQSTDRHPTEHRVSCHRCGNIRKTRQACSATSCRYVFCARCVDKLRLEHGNNSFVDGCPVCKHLCCCSNRTTDCLRKNHCYRKCPKTRMFNLPFSRGNFNSTSTDYDGEGVVVMNLNTHLQQGANGGDHINYDGTFYPKKRSESDVSDHQSGIGNSISAVSNSSKRLRGIDSSSSSDSMLSSDNSRLLPVVEGASSNNMTSNMVLTSPVASSLAKSASIEIPPSHKSPPQRDPDTSHRQFFMREPSFSCQGVTGVFVPVSSDFGSSAVCELEPFGIAVGSLPAAACHDASNNVTGLESCTDLAILIKESIESLCRSQGIENSFSEEYSTIIAILVQILCQSDNATKALNGETNIPQPIAELLKSFPVDVATTIVHVAISISQLIARN